MSFKLSTIIATAALFSSPQIFAEQNSPIIVEATHPPAIFDDHLASVTVITREEIEKSQSQSVQDLLTGSAGISFAKSGGGNDKTTNIYLRGTNENHVAIYIDGIRVSNATYGTPAIENIDINQIEHIEIMRGQHSALYGSDAIGGVIQIYTNGQDDKKVISVKAGAGTENTRSLSGRYQNGTDKHQLAITASHYQTEGINALESGNPDRDGYDNTTLNLNYLYKLGESSSVNVTHNDSEGTKEYDESFGFASTVEKDFHQTTTGITTQLGINDVWDSTIVIARNCDKNTNYETSISTFDTQMDQLKWTNEVIVSDDAITTFGADYTKESLDSTVTYQDDTRTNRGLFAQHHQRLDNHSLIVALRSDSFEKYGKQSTGNINWGYQLNPETGISASYGVGYKVPTLNDLYWPSTAWSTGNPNLNAERSESYEINLNKKSKGNTLQLSLFRTHFSNMIDWYPIWGVWQPVNTPNTSIKGAEAMVNTKVESWMFGLDTSFINARNEDTGSRLPHRAEASARINLDKRFDHLQLHGDLYMQSHSYSYNGNNLVRMPGYGIANIALNYHCTDHLSLETRVGNLFDHQYQTVAGYNTLGRTLFVSAAYHL